jgi:hypothetical protein
MQFPDDVAQELVESFIEGREDERAPTVLP